MSTATPTLMLQSKAGYVTRHLNHFISSSHDIFPTLFIRPSPLMPLFQVRRLNEWQQSSWQPTVVKCAQSLGLQVGL